MSDFPRLAVLWAPEARAVPPELPSELNETAILIFSKTNGFRHELDLAITWAAGLDGGRVAVVDVLRTP